MSNQNHRCTNKDCYVHEGETCHDGELNHEECKNWQDGEPDYKALYEQMRKENALLRARLEFLVLRRLRLSEFYDSSVDKNRWCVHLVDFLPTRDSGFRLGEGDTYQEAIDNAIKGSPLKKPTTSTLSQKQIDFVAQCFDGETCLLFLHMQSLFAGKINSAIEAFEIPEKQRKQFRNAVEKEVARRGIKQIFKEEQ